MLSMTNMSSEQAAHYYQKDQNYYTKETQSIGIWQGKGAKALGLTGNINEKEFSRLCQGIHPKQNINLVDTTKRAGTDLTFSAPKSLSVLMELGDKEEDISLREAHDKAAKETLDYIENYAQTREQINKKRVVLNTGNLIIAKFQHDVSRELDPDLHTHCFLLNATQKQDGTWRALHNIQLYKNKMLFGQIYRNHLAKNVKELGYEIEVTNAKQGLWEIKGVDKELLKEFSTRSKQIELHMQALRLKYPNANEAKLKEMATLESRKAKDTNIDRKKIREKNRQRAKEILLKTKETLNSLKQSNKKEKDIYLSKAEVVKIAREMITEKESLFKKEQLIEESLKLSVGYYDLKEIEKTIEEDQELVNLESNIYTTKEMIQIEKEIVEYVRDTKNSMNPLSKEERAKEFIDKKFNYLTPGQKEAFLHITTTKDKMIAIQGDAGSGKTTMLQALKEFTKEDNLTGLAFTGKAAEQLENESGIKSDTLHSFLNQKKHKNNQVYIVDEATMVGSKQLHHLQNIAKKTNSKIVLLGDTKQFQTIQAGNIFLELQKRNLIKTTYMSENLRAKSEVLKELYEDIKNKNIEKAFNTLISQKMIFEEINLNNIKEQYLKDEEHTLIIASKNKDRKALNEAIRESLKDKIKNEHTFTIRENTALDEIERHYAHNYDVNQIIFINSAIEGFQAGKEAVIKKVDIKRNTVTVSNGKKDIEINLARDGGKIASFNVTKKVFGINDKIVFTKNDRKLNIKNGQTAIIKEIRDGRIYFEKDKKLKSISLNEYNYIDHGYAITDYKAQGQTSDKVIVLADSKMANMNSFYVQITRAKNDVKIYTDSIEDLLENARNTQVKTSTLDYYFQETKEQSQENTLQSNISEPIQQNTPYIQPSIQNDSSKTAYFKEFKKDGPTPKKIKRERISESEYIELKNRTNEELKLSDPGVVLNALGVDYKQKANRYIFKARADERTASANLYLDRNGEWKYKDFGSAQGGSIVNAVMDISGMDYKDSLQFCLEHTNTKDYLQERIDEITNNVNRQKIDNQKLIEKVKAQRAKNQEKAKESSINSKVVNVIHLSQRAINFLKDRGIEKVPPHFYEITGSYIKDGEERQRHGIGILTGDQSKIDLNNLENLGADIHFFKKLGNFKTQSFGAKDITFIPADSNKVAIFESKMDYAAAYSTLELKNINILIANGTGNFHKIVNNIKERSFKDIYFFNQNDKPGIEFVANIANEAGIEKFSVIKYQAHEEKMDINDLVKNRVTLRERVIKTNINEFEKTINQIKKGETYDNIRREKLVRFLGSDIKQHKVKFGGTARDIGSFKTAKHSRGKRWREEFKTDIIRYREEISELGREVNQVKEFENILLKDLRVANQNQSHSKNKEQQIRRSR